MVVFPTGTKGLAKAKVCKQVQTETRTVWVKRLHRHIRGIQHLRSTRVTNGQLFHATEVWIGSKPDLKTRVFNVDKSRECSSTRM